MPSYNPDRHKWEKEIQIRYAVPIYQRIWPNAIIEEIDNMADTNDLARNFDMNGLDKVIKLGEHRATIHLAQRFRKPRFNNYTVDFSLRYHTPGLNGDIKKAEFFYLMEAIKDDYWIPNKYVFGVTKGHGVECGGFKQFYVFNLRPLLEAIFNEEILDIGIHPNVNEDGIRDGSSAIYYSLDDLEKFVFWKLNGQKTIFDFCAREEVLAY